MEKFFYELTFSHENVEEHTYKIFDLGITGLQVIDDNSVKIFSYDIDNIDALIMTLKELGFSLTKQEKIKDENWIIRCPKELESLIVDNIKVIPIIEGNDCEIHENTDKNLLQINIIPGMAFGTGHHETTKNVLKLLQHDSIKAAAKSNLIKNALDIGTGSAILAIGATLLYNTPVLAFDNDEATIQNATENIKLNNCTNKISLFCGEINQVNNKFDLILANIYAEILLDIYEKIVNSCSDNAFLILSGIQEMKVQYVLKKYSQKFIIIDTKIENGWATLLLQIKN